MMPAEVHRPPWISNIVFVILVHIVGLATPFLYKPRLYLVILTIALWQIAGIGKVPRGSLCYLLSNLGVTMGYHRLWSHRSFEASFPLRLVLALMGTMAFQGSIKWWVLRHRLHHRYLSLNLDHQGLCLQIPGHPQRPP